VLIPDVAALIAAALQRVAPERQPLLVAVAERLAAQRYRGWAADPETRTVASQLLACAVREEEIASRIESAQYPTGSRLPSEPRLASEFGFEAVNVSDVPESSEGPEYWYSPTDQIIVTRNAKLLAWPRIAEPAEEIEERGNLPTFTDSHHNLLRILK